MRDLQAAEFLYEKAAFPGNANTLQALDDARSRLREPAAGTTAGAARAGRACAREARERDALDEHVERLAHHAEKGGLWDKAVEYLQASGAKAYSPLRQLGGRGLFRARAEGAEPSAGEPRHLEQAVDLRFELRNALLPLGEIDRILACLRRSSRCSRPRRQAAQRAARRVPVQSPFSGRRAAARHRVRRGGASPCARARRPHRRGRVALPPWAELQRARRIPHGDRAAGESLEFTADQRGAQPFRSDRDSRGRRPHLAGESPSSNTAISAPALATRSARSRSRKAPSTR